MLKRFHSPLTWSILHVMASKAIFNVMVGDLNDTAVALN